MNATTRIAPSAHPDVVITRTYHAPRALVWESFTKAEHVKAWWGPHYFSNADTSVDLRVGGTMRVEMVAPDGAVFTMLGTFQEITPPERLVMLDGAFKDADGVPGLETLTTITLTEDAGRTTVTVRNQILRVSDAMLPALAGMDEGWGMSLERLGGHLGSLALAVADDRPVLSIARIFDAPRALVWQAVTDPKHLKAWWGQKAAENEVVEMDARAGGKWRIHQRYPDGSVFKFLGEVREVVPPEKVVQTFGMEGMFEGKVIVETLTLTDLGNGKTLYKVVSEFENFEDRAGMIASGMSYGAQETMSRLAEHLAAMG